MSALGVMEKFDTKRIVLLGKTGVGKSSLANTIFGEELFKVDHSFSSGTSKCQAETRYTKGRSMTLIDTPGFFDTDRSEEEMKPEMEKCIIESAPGPHAFLVVLKVEKFTEQEQAVIHKIQQYFSDDALKCAVVVFTHGDQLSEGMNIEEYVNKSEGLNDLVRKCGGRCHIVDNKYWKNNQQDKYRNNQVQVAELLTTIDKMVRENSGRYYINEMLQEVERAIKKEEEGIRNSSGSKSQEEIRKQAKSIVFKKRVATPSQIWKKGLLYLVFAGSVVIFAMWINSKSGKILREAPLEKDVTAAPVAAVVQQKVAETVGTIAEADERVTKPVGVVQKIFVAVMEKLNDLYERTYNPWSNFE